MVEAKRGDMNLEHIVGINQKESVTGEDIGKFSFECRVLLVPEEEGGFSAHALDLPGVVSEGETEEEAIDHFKEAFRGAILEYRSSLREIPWSAVSVPEKAGSIERRVMVES